MNKKLLILNLTLLAGAIGLFVWMRSDATKIRRVFKETAELVQKEGPESVMEGALKARKLGEYFAASCVVEVPRFNVHAKVSSDDIAGSVLVHRNDVKKLKVDFEDLEIEVSRPFAEVTGRVTLDCDNAAYRLADEPFEASLKLENDHWRFARLKVRR